MSDDRPRVVTEPCMKFGRPNVLGIAVETITELVAAGDDVAAAAGEFGMRREDVLVACWWDATYGPKKRRRVWGAWAKANWSAMWHSDWASVTDPPEVAL